MSKHIMNILCSKKRNKQKNNQESGDGRTVKVTIHDISAGFNFLGQF